MDNHQNTTRSIQFAGCTYTLKVQGYNFIDNSSLILKTHIEVYERPQCSSSDTLIGMMAKRHPLGSVSTEAYLAQFQLDQLLFVKLGDPSFLNRRLTFVGEQGFTAAKDILNQATDDRILSGLNNCLLGGGVLQEFILKMCIHDVFRNRWMCILETEPLKLFAPPPRWVVDGQVFVFAQRFDDEGSATYAMYIPSGEQLPNSEGN